jgi:membrane-associated phospholipid phosphatase
MGGRDVRNDHLAVTVRGAIWAGALAATGFAIGYGAIKGVDGPEVDRELFALANRERHPLLDAGFAGVTELGSIYAAGAAAASLAASGRGRVALRAAAASVAAWLVLQGIKWLVKRPRPSDADEDGTRLLIARPRATSWPSSHPAVLTAFTRVAAVGLDLGPASRATLSALDLTVAASRVALGVHYPSDAASGLLFGRAVARLWAADPRA